MLGSIFRSAGAVIVGLIVAMAIVIGVEGVSAVLHPFPPGVDPTDFEACKAHVAQYPSGVLFVCDLGWGLCAFASCWVATRLGWGRHVAHGIVLGVLLIAAAVMNMLMLPYPAWFWASNLILLPLGCYAGTSLGRARFADGQSKTGPRDL